MADELSKINLNELTIEQVKQLKNQAIERLKAAGQLVMEQTSHQSGTHGSHSNHSTHSNGPSPLQP